MFGLRFFTKRGYEAEANGLRSEGEANAIRSIVQLMLKRDSIQVGENVRLETSEISKPLTIISLKTDVVDCNFVGNYNHPAIEMPSVCDLKP